MRSVATDQLGVGEAEMLAFSDVKESGTSTSFTYFCTSARVSQNQVNEVDVRF